LRCLVLRLTCNCIFTTVGDEHRYGEEKSGWMTDRNYRGLGGPIVAIMALLTGFSWSVPAGADDVPNIPVTLKDHQFAPAEIHVPQGKPVILTITNADPTAEEFDSSALKVEKVIAGGTYGTVRLRPLGPGRYPFMGEYHSDTARGVVVSE
jgi:hypothetical protein